MKKRFILSALALALSFSINAWSADLSKVPVKPQQGTVTLTFDDGPSPIFTPQVLNILKRYNVHATFFVMGPLAKKYPDLIKEMIANGNTVASHTISHPILTKLSNQQLQHEIGDSKKMIDAVIGKNIVCLRPPFFATNAHVRDVIQNNNMIQILGFMTEDYKNQGSEWLVNNVLTHVHSGSILVLHDGYRGRAQTVAALPAIIEGIKKKGLGFSVICNS